MLTTSQAADMLGVRPATIRSWRNRGWLKRQGLDERGHPLHTPEALRAAEKLVTGHGIAATGINPRRLRGRPRQETAA
jgi:DNA-binding transcriptional MerR regulator